MKVSVNDYVRITNTYKHYDLPDVLYKVVTILEVSPVNDEIYSREIGIEDEQGTQALVFEVDLVKVNKVIYDMYNKELERSKILDRLNMYDSLLINVRDKVVRISSSEYNRPGIAICNPKDKFDLSYGLFLAYERMINGGFPLEGDTFFYINDKNKISMAKYDPSEHLYLKSSGNVFFTSESAKKSLLKN